MAVIDDKRADTATRPVLGYVVATDSFLSGWGLAPGRSLIAFPVNGPGERDTVLANLRGRDEMKRPRIVARLDSAGRPAVRLGAGDHLSIRDPESARAFYRPDSFAPHE